MRKTILFIALGIALTSQSLFAQVPSYVPTNGLVGYWPFNGNANDESGNGNNGVVNGATLTTDRNGNINKSYSFVNSNIIQIASKPSLNIAANYSIALWYLTTADTYPAQDVIIKGINDYTGQSCYLRHHSSTFASPNLSYVSGAQMPYTSLTTDLPPINIWHFIVVNIHNSQGDLYIDNNLVNSIFFPNLNNMINSTPLKIGGGYYNFNGKIDDIGFWNRSLTTQEITNLYNSVSSNECLTMTINTGVLSTNPVTYTSSVSIYPNPANDQITIDCGNLANVSGWSIKITNLLGQEVFSQPMNTQQYVVPLNTWSGQGMYFVKIINAQNEVVNIKKIILQ